MNYRDKGQNIIEFAIIIAVVALGGIFAFTLLGGNINTMFSKSNDAVKEYKPFGNNTTSTSTDGTSSTPDGGGTSETINVDGTDITYNSDGSTSFTVGGQEIAMSADVMNNLNTVFETSGAGGMTSEVMAAIQSLVSQHEGDYANGEMPLNIQFGTSSREKNNQTYEGNAEANIVTLTVGDHMIIINKDQDYEKDGVKFGCDASEAKCSMTKLDGIIDSSGKFIGQTTEGSDILSMDFNVDSDGNIEGQLGSGWSWDIDFSDTNQSIKI